MLDNSLVVFGPRVGDAAANRSEALVALGKVMDPKGAKLRLRSSSMEIVAAPGGRSAWAFDSIAIDGKPHAVLAVLTNIDDLWLVKAAVVASTPSHAAIKRARKKQAVVPPGGTAKANVESGADAVVDRFEKGLLDQASWGDDLGHRSDAIVIGPAANEITRGKKAIKKMWKKRVAAHTRAVISGELVASITGDGKLAWVTAPITRVSDDEPPTPLRAFAVFQRLHGDWKMIALQESIAVDQPGTGKAYEKAVPALPEEKPASSDAKVDKTKKKHKKKRRKKKRKKKKKKVERDD